MGLRIHGGFRGLDLLPSHGIVSAKFATNHPRPKTLPVRYLAS